MFFLSQDGNPATYGEFKTLTGLNKSELHGAIVETCQSHGEINRVFTALNTNYRYSSVGGAHECD